MSSRKKSTPSPLSPTNARLSRRGSQDRKVLHRVATDEGSAPKPTLTKDGSRRVFYAQGKPYEIPILPPPENDEDEAAHPPAPAGGDGEAPVTFVDGQGRLYDKSYRLLSHQDAMASDRELFESFPSPKNCDNYSTFQQNLFEWHARVQANTSHIILPLITGRRYYRPRADTFMARTDSDRDHSDAGSESNKDSPATTPLSVDDADADGELGTEPFAADTPVDRWETILVPAEPTPELYDTFPEYEMAMCRWAAVCSDSMATVPPHPSQLSSLISICTAAEKRLAEKERELVRRKQQDQNDNRSGNRVADDDDDASLWPVSLRVPTDDPEAPFPLRTLPSPTPDFSPFDFERNFDAQSSGTLEKVHAAFPDPTPPPEEAEDGEETSKGPVHQGHRARMHASRLPHQLLPCGMINRESILNELRELREAEEMAAAAVVDTTRTQPGSRQSFSTSRTVTPPPAPKVRKPVSVNLAMRFPCDYVLAEGEVPELQLEAGELVCRPFSVEGVLGGDIPRAQGMHAEIMGLGRFDSLYGWYHGGAGDLQPERPWHFVADRPLDSLTELLLLDDYLDVFIARYSNAVDTDNESCPLLEVLVPRLPNPGFRRLLELYDRLQSPLPRAKLAYLLGSFLSSTHCVVTEAAKQGISSLLRKRDVCNLYRLALLLNYFNEAPVVIYPLHESVLDLALQMEPGAEPVIRRALTSYYFNIILQVLMTHEAFASSRTFFQSKFEMMEADLSLNGLEADEMIFLREYLPRGLLHHSQVVSQLYTMALGRMLCMSAKCSTAEILSREGVGLVDLLRTMCLSCYSHVQVAGKKLLEMMLRNSSHLQILRTYYQSDPSLIVMDLFGTVDDVLATPLADVIALYVEQELTAMAMKGLSVSTISRYKHLMQGGREGALFHDVLEQLLSAQSWKNRVYAYGARLLVLLLETFWALEIIECYETLSGTQSSMSKHLLIIPADAMRILDFVCHSPIKETHQSFFIKTKLLECLGVLVKHPQVFETISRDKTFLNNLLQCCRRGDDYVMNQAAWQVFFACFKWHHGAFQESEENVKFLSHLFELISPGVNNTVISNCLNTVCDVLTLVESEAIKVQETGRTSRGDEDLKFIEKDVKAFVSLLVKHCLKVHLVYKRLEFNHIGGVPYLSVSNFYYQVHLLKNKANINGPKLYKELTKNRDYKSLVQDTLTFYGPRTAEYRSPSMTNLKRATLRSMSDRAGSPVPR